MQRPVESPLYCGLVPGELRERVGPIGVPGEGAPECGSLVFLITPHLANPGECLLVPLFLGYGDICGLYYGVQIIRFVSSGLTLRPFGQLLGALPGEYASLHPAQAPEPPIGGNYPIDEKVLQLSGGLQLISE